MPHSRSGGDGPVPIEGSQTELNDVRLKLDELGSDEAAQYALRIGLRPPGYLEGSPESIVEFWARDADLDGPGTLVWGSTMPYDPAEDDDDEDEDGDDFDVWANVAPPGSFNRGETLA